MYGFSIIFMIASLSLKDRREERGLHNYIKDFEKFRTERRQFQTARLAVLRPPRHAQSVHCIQESERSTSFQADDTSQQEVTQDKCDADVDATAVTSQQQHKHDDVTTSTVVNIKVECQQLLDVCHNNASDGGVTPDVQLSADCREGLPEKPKFYI